MLKKLGSISSMFTCMEGQLFGLTIKELCKLIFQIAERNHIKHPFNARDNFLYEVPP